MTISDDSTSRSKRVAEPVQVYLDPEDQDRLARLAAQLDTSKSAVLRLGLGSLERQLQDPAAHPALQLIGLVEAETAAPKGSDVARDHDRVLAESELKSWDRPSPPVAGSE